MRLSAPTPPRSPDRAAGVSAKAAGWRRPRAQACARRPCLVKTRLCKGTRTFGLGLSHRQVEATLSFQMTGFPSPVVLLGCVCTSLFRGSFLWKRSTYHLAGVCDISQHVNDLAPSVNRSQTGVLPRRVGYRGSPSSVAATREPPEARRRLDSECVQRVFLSPFSRHSYQ